VRKIALLIVFAAAVMSVGGGVRYLLAPEFMPYHAEVVGKSWSQLDPRIQAIILGLLKIVGAGFFACGVSLFWLLRPLSKGEVWSRWAVLSIGLSVWAPTQYVTLYLRTVAPEAHTPVALTASILALVVAGTVAHFLVPQVTNKGG
jgi:hypothetical protein